MFNMKGIYVNTESLHVLVRALIAVIKHLDILGRKAFFPDYSLASQLITEKHRVRKSWQKIRAEGDVEGMEEYCLNLGILESNYYACYGQTFYSALINVLLLVTTPLYSM